jgi:PTS system nitrogen regulatory IIA component
MNSDVMDLEQLASFLGRDPRELGKLANRGHLPGRKVGGEWRFATAEIQNWVESEMPGWTEQELQGIDREQTAGYAAVIAPLISIESIDLNFGARTKNSAIRDLVKRFARRSRSAKSAAPRLGPAASRRPTRTAVCRTCRASR